ncbi:DUF2474 family protein [Roseovarius sp. MBR-6]|jgi:hypothetical protein
MSPILRHFGWFVLLWLLGIGALGAVATLIRLFI